MAKKSAAPAPVQVVEDTRDLPDLEIIYKPIHELIPYARNSRTHSEEQIDKIVASMKKLGWTNPILLDGTNGIIAGHARLRAAVKRGYQRVPCIELSHLSDADKRAAVIMDNQLALDAEWDIDMLKLEVGELSSLDYELELLGFPDAELSDLLAAPAKGGFTDEDEIPEVPEQPVTQKGDVWLLGEHRVACGDATVVTDLERLFGGKLGEQADLVFTDPPYNVAYEGYTKEKLTIKNDAMGAKEFIAFLDATFKSYAMVCKKGASLYVCHPSSYQREFQNALEAAGYELRQQIIWAKNTFAWGHGRYKFQHEPIFYAHLKGQSDQWYGDKTQSTLWQEKKPAANRLHPTMKPVELIERALTNSSKSGDLIVDLFGGSGSTLIASQKFNRRCFMMELDPRYCDVIVKRWQSFVGEEATLESTGENFNTLKPNRARH